MNCVIALRPDLHRFWFPVKTPGKTSSLGAFRLREDDIGWKCDVTFTGLQRCIHVFLADSPAGLFCQLPLVNGRLVVRADDRRADLSQ